MKIEAFIFNWRGHESRAVALEQQLGRLARVTVINSDEQAVAAHPQWVHLGETAYFAAQWNKAVERFSADLFFHIQADVSYDDFERLLARAAALFERLPLGIYEPNIDYTALLYDWKRLRSIEPDVYEVPLTDCTCWCIHRDVVDCLPRVDTSLNKFGWGVCEAMAAISRRKKMLCVRDYSVTVLHPRSRGYSSEEASSELTAYVGRLPQELQDEVRLMYRERDNMLERADEKRGLLRKRPFSFLGRIFGSR